MKRYIDEVRVVALVPDAVKAKVRDYLSRQPQAPEVVGVKESQDLLDTSRSNIKRLRDMGSFPEPIAVLEAGPVFLKEDVLAFGRQQEHKRQQKAAARSARARDNAAAGVGE